MPDPSLTPDKTVIVDDGSREPNPPAPFVELGLTSCFSFLRGASDAREFAEAAYPLGYDALGIADRNTMAGVVRMHINLKGARVRPVIGCRLDLAGGPSFLAYPTDRAAYGRLCTLLSRGKMFDQDGGWQAKDACHLSVADLARHAEGLVLIVLPDDDIDVFAAKLPLIVRQLPTLSHVAASYLYRGGDRARINRLDALARGHGLGLLATNDVHYHEPARRPLQDVVTCIREGTTIAEAGYLLDANAERHLKSPVEMVRLFAAWPHAIAATRDIADRCTFSLDELKYEYPDEEYPDGRTAQQHLEALSWEGAAKRYPPETHPGGIPDKVRNNLVHEFGIIRQMDIARYFLTVREIVAFAESREPPILCQGRGSAANSTVCYCLRITAVDPTETDLLFDRFITPERSEPPDIDIDFEHERREEVIQHLYDKYGRTHAGLCATIIHYRPRSAIREVGKVMGLSEDVTAAVARTIWGSWGPELEDERVAEAGLDLADPQMKRVLALTRQLIGKPRHLSQHVGGFILTRNPLTETVPIGNGAMPDRSFIEWDKDDIDALGIFKIDVLALGMLTCIRKSLDLIAAHGGERYDLATVPREDSRVYDMLCKGDSLGVFQVESRAQMNMLPRLKPRCYYDLVIEVAIVRPGPIQGDMVHPYLKRRDGREKVEYPSPAPEHGDADELEKILKRTLGVPIFQEQAMKIALDAAKFSAAEANGLRKAMATFRSRGTIETLQSRMVDRMVERGYDREFSQRCFDQIKGFGEYGFPESHAASFAHLVYISSWIKCFHPAAFACGLLNSQPMGFYAPAQIVRDAIEHGVEVRHPDVNYSNWDNTLEILPGPARGGGPFGEAEWWRGASEASGDQQAPPPSGTGVVLLAQGSGGGTGPRHALRLGLRQIDGLHFAAAADILKRRDRPYTDVEDFKTRSGVNVAAVQKLAAADAFRSMGLDRRQALWDSRTLRAAPDLPLFTFADTRSEGAEEEAVQLPETPLSEHVVSDYQTLRLSLKAHPLSFLRPALAASGHTRAADLRACRFGQPVRVSGIVLIRQKPGTAKGVCFITLEDETGVCNLVIWPDTMKKYRRTVMSARLMAVRGTVQMDDAVIHVIAHEIFDRSEDLSLLSADAFKSDLARADHVVAPLPHTTHRHPRDVEIIPKSRDFH